MNDLASTVGRERDHLLRAGAALQLLPQNATKWARFERLLEVSLAAEPTAEQRAVSNRRLRQLLTTPPIATPQLVAGEDPFEESFTAAMTFYGGAYRAVLGGISGAHAGCQLVLEAVRSLNDDAERDYKREVLRDATVLLKLSEAVCDRAGLGRWDLPFHSPRTKLLIPAAPELDRLCNAVSFSQEELSTLLGPAVAGVQALTAPGRLSLVDHDHESPTDDRIYFYPLVEVADSAIVAALPSGLATSITARALAAGVDRGLTDQVVAAIHESTQQAMRRYLERVRWRPVAAPPELSEPRLGRESFYRFDADKFAHVVSVVDPLVDYSPGSAFGHADFGDIQDELHERFVMVREAIRGEHADASVLHLACSAPLGRSFFIGFTDAATDDRSALLVLTADDLDVMTRIEAPDPLGLWKFAVALGRLHEESRVVSFSKLDEYAIYREYGNGFYMSDDGHPTMVSIAVGSGGELRANERLRLDQHGAVLPDGDRVVEVSRWPADDNSPVYRPDDPKLHHLHLVEITAPCWVVPAPEAPEETGPSEDLAEAIAFWLWRCRDMLAFPLTGLLTAHPMLIVTVRFMSQSPNTDERESGGVEPSSSWLACEATPGENRVRVTLLDGAASKLRGPGNHAERVVASSAVEAVHHLLGRDEEGTRERVVAALPSGPMKMLQVLGAEDDLLLSLGYTAAPRLVPAADVEQLLDEVGAIAREGLGLREGPIPSADRIRVLNDIVDELFARLSALMSEIDSDGLLEDLSAEQEAIAYVEARNQLLVTSQAACFGDDSSAVRRVMGSSRDLTSTAIASRFIIECATANTPTGTRIMSVGLYDSLLAIARQIVEFGYLSDALRYGLSSAELSVLPSGRLGVSRAEPYYEALNAYTGLIAGRSLGRARRAFARHWARPAEEGQPFDPSDLNEAFESEFGVTATEMSQLTGELMELARGERRQIATRPLEELIGGLARSLEWAPERVRTAIGLLTLGPLDQFPPTTNRADSYPWRFSRDRSAARRPLLLRARSDSDVEIVWGPRAVYRAGRYLLDQILSARLKTRSDRMREYVTAARQAANADFNHEVASFYRSIGFEDVRENVMRIGKLRLARPNGDAIGDIDVLVTDPARKVLLAVEVKDFEFARTPFELSNEIEKLLDGPHSAAHHHEERLRFLRTNLQRVAAELNLPGEASEWQVLGLIVTSNDLMAAHFPKVEALGKNLSIVSFEDLVARPADQLTARRRPQTRRASRRRNRKRRR
jgi:hypothetical protein